MRKKMLALALGGLMALAGVSTAQADSARESDDTNGLEGTWRVQVTTRDCASGSPLLTFPALLTFARGGTLTGTTSSRAFQPGQRTSDYGMWSAADDDGYRAVSEAFILSDSSPNPPAPPLQRGVQRITQAIVVQGDAFNSNATVQFFDVNGNVVVSGCSTAVGARMR
jgi:hypothetical protein